MKSFKLFLAASIVTTSLALYSSDNSSQNLTNPTTEEVADQIPVANSTKSEVSDVNAPVDAVNVTPIDNPTIASQITNAFNNSLTTVTTSLHNGYTFVSNSTTAQVVIGTAIVSTIGYVVYTACNSNDSDDSDEELNS